VISVQPMDDDAEKRDLRRLAAREQAEEEARLARAREEARARGKEPFDLDRLEELYETRSDLGERPRAERQQTWEWKYYVQDADAMTLAEFAERQRKLDPYR